MLDRPTAALAELRLDIDECDQSKLRLGLSVTVAVVAVAATGWPPGDVLQRALFIVLFLMPVGGIGVGIFIGELIQARTERRGELRADSREIRALRQRIAEDRAWRMARASGEPLPGPLVQVAPVRPTRRAGAPAPPRVSVRRQVRTPFRSGYLRLK